MMNSKKPKTNTSGVKGVSWHKIIKKWRAHIQVNGKELHLGYYDELEKATEARFAAVEKIFREFAHESERTENV